MITMLFNTLLAAAMLLLPGSVLAQYCTQDARYSQSPIFAESQIQVVTNLEYGKAINRDGVEESLMLDVAYPKPAEDTATSRPIIMLVHGGGFVGGDKSDLLNNCVEFARRGYVAATINYRLGRMSDETCNDSLDYLRAVYRAVQDANAAMRYIVQNAGQVRGDTNWIFAGGGSAGAGTVLQLTFIQQAEIDAIAPRLRQEMGRLDTSGNSLRNTFDIKGVYNNWGAVVDTLLLTAADAVPVLSFHAEFDQVVPVDAGINNGCPGAKDVYGSRSIHRRMGNLGMCSQFVFAEGVNSHGIYGPGTFRLEKAACFFKSIFCNSCTSFLETDSIPASCDNPATAVITARIHQLLAYPNPATGTVTLTGLPDGLPVHVQLTDATGQVVLTASTPVLNLAQLPAGLYVATAVAGGQRYSTRLAVQ